MHIRTRTSDMCMEAGSAGRNRTFLSLGTTVVVLAVMVSVWLLSRPAAPPALPQVTRSELEVRDGRLYRNGQTSPFTGTLVELRSDGSLQSRSVVSNGLLHGISEGWHTNGQLAVRETFRDGVSDGVRVKWHANGAKMSEANIVGGKVQGTFRRWHENGLLAEQIEMRDGRAEGLSIAYYPSGYLRAKATLHQGQPAGQQFWKDGELKE
jgi:antitoxin component YwqK of YwqJK toxin-antitoxin module